MAKHCTICNRDYADNLAACPHCAGAETMHPAGSGEERVTQLIGRGDERATRLAGHTSGEQTASDSAIDLGSPTPSRPATSDASSSAAEAWGGGVEAAPDANFIIDSPAGPHEERVGELGVEEPASATMDAGAGAERVELSSSPPQSIKQTSDSEVDLGAAPRELAESDSGALVKGTPGSESAIFMAELVGDAPEGERVSDSGMDLSEDPRHSVSEVGDSSAVDLGASSFESEEGLPAEEDAEAGEVREGSGIDLEGLPTLGASPSDSSGSSSDSSVDLGSHAEITTSSPSEEGVEAVADSDVDREKFAQPSQPTSDDALESLLSETRSSEPAVEEPPVSEKEVDELLAELEEKPGAGQTAGEAAEIAEGEDALAAAEAEEEAAAAEAKEQEKPAKPVKQPSRILSLVGATGLGILLGVGGDMGVRALMGPGEKEKAPVQTNMRAAVPAPPPVTFDTLKAMVSNGDWEGANKAGIDTAPANKPEEYALRGQYRLGEYLQKNGHKFSNAQDPNLQPAIQDLQQAGDQNPYAVYDLALIKELAGDLQGARAEYAKGAQTFANDPVQKQRFEAAIARVEWKESLKVPKRSGAAMLPLPKNGEDRAAMLALLLVALQQPNQQPDQQPPQPNQQPGQQAAQAGQQPAQADTQEAGFEFWKAAKLAHEGKFSDAIQTIDKARTLHDQRRFSRLRKAQNPLSDPAEDVFLRCCDELKVYWQLENRLRDGGYLTDKNTPPEALQALVQKADASAAAMKNLTGQLTTAKIIGKDEDVTKGLTRLLNEKKAADANVAQLKTMLQTAKDESAKLDEKVKSIETTIKERDADLTSAKEQNAKQKSENDKLNTTLTKIRDELADAKFLDPKGDVSEAVKKAVDVAKSKDAQGTLRQQRDEIAQLSASLKQSWRPEEMLTLWLLLLDENRSRLDLAGKAEKDAERIRMDPKATDVQKGEAAVVLGLALRNADQFDKAKSVLEAARGSMDKGELLLRAEAALREVSDPAAYLTAQAQLWYDHGQMDTALAVLKRAEQVLPAKELGKLMAKRSLIELDAARSKTKGTLPPTEPLLIAARKDAEAAAKAGAAEGHYAAGRIAEEFGQMDEAIKSYRAALAAHGNQMDAEGGRYRMALARVLLLPREVRPNQPAAPANVEQKLGWRDPAPYPAEHFADMKRFVLMVVLGLQAPLLPADEQGKEEAEKLADDVLKASPGTVPFNVLAQALAIKGRWNAALQTYVEGIRPLLPREYGDGLVYLFRNDPRLKRPDSQRTPNPLDAEKHFAAGLTFYFDRDYGNAEKEFLLTVENDSQDARFFYFLGLSRLAQNRRRDAYADFNQGVMLERLNRPAPAAVDESLERIQGPARFSVNESRQRPER